ncbi:hypothetical protein [Virgibacillus kimchii]
MKHIDWQMLFFVGGPLIQEFWIYYGLPRVYYFSAPQDKIHEKNKDAA